MILAATDGDWIVPLIVVIFGFLNWVWSKLKSASPTPPSTRSQPTATRRPVANPEEERMRKFIEALGVPSDSAPEAGRTPPRESPPLRREPPPLAGPEAPGPARIPPPPLPAATRRAARIPVEQLSVAELVTPAVVEFATVSSTIGAIPTERQSSVALTADTPSRGERLRQELASATQIRSAFLLREILGPPLGLQS